MEHKIGDKQKLIIPLVAFVVIATFVALIIYPVVSATPKGISLAVLSLDEGTITPMGKMNAGDMVIEKLASGELATSAQDGKANEESPVEWTTLKTQSDLDAAMEANEYYAALVIPKDFTKTSVAAGAGTGEQTVPSLIINQGKNPAIASTIETMFGSMLSSQDMTAEIKYINAVSSDLGTGVMAQQMCYMLTILISTVMSIVLFIATGAGAAVGRKKRLGRIVTQVIYACVLGLGIGWFVSFFMTTFANIALPFVSTMLFVWLAAFALMVLFLGLFSLHPALGALGIATVIVCGLTTGLLPYEVLPGFWQNWLYPWVPERFVADGLSQMLYMGVGVFNSSGVILAAIAGGGIVLVLLSLIKSEKSADGIRSISAVRGSEASNGSDKNAADRFTKKPESDGSSST